MDSAQVSESVTSPAAATSTTVKRVWPKLSVVDDATGVSVREPITVTSRGDGLEEVTLTNESGKQVKATMAKDRMSWTTTEPLGYGRTYTLYARDKNRSKRELKFTTEAPAATAGVALSPLPDSEVGVGQTIAFRFSSPVPDRKAAQKALKVTTEPAVEGAFYWLNDYEVRWRPKDLWEPGTAVTVEANIYGVDLGKGLYGREDNTTNFRIGDRVVAIVDDEKKTMTVWKNRQLLRTIPVSLGRDTAEWATPNGRYIVGDQHEEMVMDSMTFGLDYNEGGYKTKVKYATQLSYSGIYVHSAPWSVWAQGKTNTSHGCINVSEEAAQWFQQLVKRGDVVRVINTKGGVLPVTDGLGDWNLSWEEWSAGNA